MEQVILVDRNDQYLGTMEKMEAHEKAVLHRAFSVFIFNSAGEMLLQQRAFSKYHSGGLWTNSCCSHPRPGEETNVAALRRLKEELGFETPLEKIFDFVYDAAFDNGLTEHEFDHVFVGYADRVGLPDPAEVAAIEFRSLPVIERQISETPEQFTAWFRIAFPKVMEWWRQQQIHAA
jgi:isopentenyl-diphosphate delta-isomerase